MLRIQVLRGRYRKKSAELTKTTPTARVDRRACLLRLAEYLSYVKAISAWANLDFFSFFNISCLTHASFLDAAMIKIAIPTAVLFMAIVAVVLLRCRDKRGKSKIVVPEGEAGEGWVAAAHDNGDDDVTMADKIYGFAVLFVFVIFVSVSNAIFSVGRSLRSTGLRRRGLRLCTLLLRGTCRLFGNFCLRRLVLRVACACCWANFALAASCSAFDRDASAASLAGPQL